MLLAPALPTEPVCTVLGVMTGAASTVKVAEPDTEPTTSIECVPAAKLVGIVPE